MGKFKDLTGQVFERWTALSYVKVGGRTHWNCECSCGTLRAVNASDLVNGKSKSCGCLKNETTSKLMTTHGMSKSVEYRHYAGMLARCSDTDDKNYEDYGARGITVCEEFLDDFLNFYREMGPKPTDGQRWSVGRIDNNQGYNVGNVRWELDATQARNHSLQKNNTSGHAGINIRYTERDGDRVVARYNTLDGERVSKSFSVGKLGLDKAMSLAVGWRKEKILELNAMGAGYAESHGTVKKVVV